jgi:hypothetical protein
MPLAAPVITATLSRKAFIKSSQAKRFSDEGMKIEISKM